MKGIHITKKIEALIYKEWCKVCNAYHEDGHKYDIERKCGLVFKSKVVISTLKPEFDMYFNEKSITGCGSVFVPNQYYKALFNLHLHCSAGRDLILDGPMCTVYEMLETKHSTIFK